MVNKRPHVLTYQIEGTASQDGNGRWVEQANAAVVTMPCRADASDSGKTVKGEDGQDINFGYTVYVASNAATIPVGQLIKLFNNGVKFFEGSVKRFEREQFKCRIWA